MLKKSDCCIAIYDLIDADYWIALRQLIWRASPQHGGAIFVDLQTDLFPATTK